MNLSEEQMQRVGAKLRQQRQPQFVVCAFATQFNNEWLVVRVRDRRVMTSGGVTVCARWVQIWGPMHQ